MSVTFHDGSHHLYQRYAPQAWNDMGLLRLNDGNQYDSWLMRNCNTEAAMRALLRGGSLANCYPFGVGTSKLSEYIAAGETGIIVIKGLHQWQRIGRSWNYKLHMSFGLEGRLWHLNALYKSTGGGSVAFTSECTAGETTTTESHDGFQRVGRRR